jgi:hypothetical protein
LVCYTKEGLLSEGAENRVLRRISGPKREEMVEAWRRLNNEELLHLYASPNIIKMIK